MLVNVFYAYCGFFSDPLYRWMNASETDCTDEKVCVNSSVNKEITMIKHCLVRHTILCICVWCLYVCVCFHAQEHALKGHEGHVNADGQYSKALRVPATHQLYEEDTEASLCHMLTSVSHVDCISLFLLWAKDIENNYFSPFYGFLGWWR